MKRERVESSLLRGVGYDPASSILALEFAASRAVYEYYDVPYSAYEELMAADSKGGYFDDFIRDQYPHRVTRKAPAARGRAARA